MGKRTKLAIGAAGVLVAGWTGMWFWGKSALQSQIDEQILLMRDDGIYASYKAIEVSGFPFAYRGRLTEPRYQAPIVSAQGMGQAQWQADWLAFDAKVQEFGAMDFTLPNTQKMVVRLPGSAGPMDVVLGSQHFTGRVVPGGSLSFQADAEGLTVTATPMGEAPFEGTAEAVSLDLLMPGQSGGPLAGSLRASDVNANDPAWDLLDPSGSLPRHPVVVDLALKGDTIERENGPPLIQSVQIESMSVQAMGLTIVGEGAAVVEGAMPDGSVALRIGGLSGFFDNLATTGHFPAQQVAVVRVMVESLGRAGAGNGEKLYDIEFKNGAATVNGMAIPPSFLPQ